jgi:hypothetical protein
MNRPLRIRMMGSVGGRNTLLDPILPPIATVRLLLEL